MQIDDTPYRVNDAKRSPRVNALILLLELLCLALDKRARVLAGHIHINASN